MPQDATCTACKHEFPVAESRTAFTVACPKCEADLTVEFKKPATPPEAGQPPYELLVKPGALANSQPAATTRKRKDDDNEEPTRNGGSMMVVLLSGGLGLLFVLGGLSLTGWYLFTQVDIEDTSSASSSRSNSNNSGNRGNNNNNNVRPKGNDPFTPPRPKGNDPFNPPKPKDTFDLRPVGGTVPAITPPRDIDAANPKTILLPGRANAVAIGGGGRYLVFHFPDQGRLSVFDASAGDIVTSATTENGGVFMTAGANKLVTTAPGNKLRVYSLPDLRRDRNEIEVPLFAGPRGIAMGSRTNGPVLAVNPFGEVALFDLASGKPIEGARAGLQIPNAQLRATADGRMFLAGNGYNSHDKFKIVEESLRKWQVKSPEIAAAAPSADGRVIYGKDVIINTNGTVLAEKPAALAHAWFVPAVTATGNYFLKVNEVKIGTPPRIKNGVSVAVHRNNNVNQPVLTAWEGLPEIEGLVHGGGGAEVLDQHLFLIPEAKLLVILNRDRNRLVVRKLQI